jgi:hypothetical protein
MVQTTRGRVLEQSVILEAGISELIGFLLEINTEKSLSLGNKKSALSFNAKVNLLCDLKFVPKNIISQLQLFAEIRNKFAHVHSVDSFVACFEVLKEKKSNFLKLLGTVQDDCIDEETQLDICFTILCTTIEIWLRTITDIIHAQKSVDLKKNAAVEYMRLTLKLGEHTKESFKAHIEELTLLLSEIPKDKDFI